MLSAICFNLNQSKVLSPGNGLTSIFSTVCIVLSVTTSTILASLAPEYILGKDKSETLSCVNPLPDMPSLGSSNSMANKDMMSKIWTNGNALSD